MGYQWKISDEAIELCDIFLQEYKKRSKQPQLVLKKDDLYFVSDVLQSKCSTLLNIGVEIDVDNEVYYFCRKCTAYHLAKKEENKTVFFPSIWFTKRNENSVSDTNEENVLLEDDSKFRELIFRKVKKKTPIEVPKKLHDKKKSEEKEIY